MKSDWLGGLAWGPRVGSGHRAKGRALLVGLSLETVSALPWTGIAWCSVVVIGAVVTASAATLAALEVEVPALLLLGASPL